MIAQDLLLFSLAFVFYAYFGYPLLLAVALIVIRRKTIERRFPGAGDAPLVTVIIAARNEMSTIREKLKNTLALQYPDKRAVQIIVASDCSDDETNSIVEAHREQGVVLMSLTKREGKERAQEEALKFAKGEIVLFTDARSMLEPEAITNIVSYFADRTVGAVSSVDQVASGDSEQGSGDKYYVRYEMWLRQLESNIGSLVGLSGSCFAVRRALCVNWRSDIPSDFHLLLEAQKQGYRGVHGEDVVCHYRSLKTEELEFTRKVRTVLRGMTTLFSCRDVLNPSQYGFFSFQLISHKLCRWLVPFCLILAGVSLCALAGQSFWYLILFSLAVLFLAFALGGYIVPAYRRNALVKIALFFTIVNLAVLVSWWKYLTGKRAATWEPTGGKV